MAERRRWVMRPTVVTRRLQVPTLRALPLLGTCSTILPSSWAQRLGASAGTAVPRTDDPKDCKKWLEVDFLEPWDSITQYLDFSALTASSDGGASEQVALDFAISVRSLDDNAEALDVSIHNDDGTL